MIMLYIFDEIDLLDDDFPENVSDLLSIERREKVQRLSKIHGKKASAVVYLLLRLTLKDIYGINEIIEFDYNSMQKPYLQKYPQIFFNFSHSHNAGACAAASYEIGVDVQQIVVVKENVARRVLTVDEFSTFKSVENPNEYFCKAWTIKESYLKLTGQGISDELRDISVVGIQDKMIYRGRDYFCCVCGSGAKAMQIKHIGRDDFEQLQN